jgi:hypothetical protein
MTTTAPPIITCPVCGASGSMLHHDIRSSLVYSCLNCTHEWEIDPIAATTADLQSACAEGHSDGDGAVLDFFDGDC